MASLEVKQCMKRLLLFLPQLLALCGRLLVDHRVPRTEKALLLGAVAYAIVPFDLIPDFLPFVGQIDDTYLISLTLLRLISRTDEHVINEHWHGGGDLAKLAAAIAGIAPLVLPQRVRRVLTSRVEVVPKGENNSSSWKQAKQEATLIELQDDQ